MKKYLVGLFLTLSQATLPLYAVTTKSVVEAKGVREVSVVELAALLKANKNVVVVFYTTWCPACKEFLPTVDQSQAELKGLVIVKIDLDKGGVTGVESIPTTLLFKNGKVVWGVTGGTTKEIFVKELKKQTRGK